MQDRRHFLKTGFSIAAAGLAGAAALTRARRSVADEAPPETTSVRLLYWKDGRLALRRLTSSTISCVTRGSPTSATYPAQISDIGADRLASGDADFVQDFAATTIPRIDAGVPALMLAGVHPACFELFAHELIRSVIDLKGKTVGVSTTTARAPPTISCSRSSPPASGSIPPRTSIGSPAEGPVETTFSQTAKSMRS